MPASPALTNSTNSGCLQRAGLPENQATHCDSMFCAKSISSILGLSAFARSSFHCLFASIIISTATTASLVGTDINTGNGQISCNCSLEIGRQLTTVYRNNDRQKQAEQRNRHAGRETDANQNRTGVSVAERRRRYVPYTTAPSSLENPLTELAN